MKKTFCDHCERQCVNSTTRIDITTVHHTKNGQFAGEDQYRQIDICHDCLEDIREVIPEAFVIRNDDKYPGEDSHIAAVQAELTAEGPAR